MKRKAAFLFCFVMLLSLLTVGEHAHAYIVSNYQASLDLDPTYQYHESGFNPKLTYWNNDNFSVRITIASSYISGTGFWSRYPSWSKSFDIPKGTSLTMSFELFVVNQDASASADKLTVTMITAMVEPLDPITFNPLGDIFWLPARSDTLTIAHIQDECVSDGASTHTMRCICGHISGDPIPHTAGEWIVTAAATCVSPGAQVKKCTACNALMSTDTISVNPSAHNFTAYVFGNDATCTEDGTETALCSYGCGTTDTRTAAGSSLGHMPVIDPAIPSTCTFSGLSEGVHCSVCTEVLIGQEPVEKLPHTQVTDSAVPATCTVTGLTEGEHCAVCGEVIAAQQIVPILPHTEVISQAIPASCTATGLTEGEHCAVCGEVTAAQQIVPMLPHTEVISPAIPATCTASGLTQGKYCSICKAILTAQQTIPARGHDYAAAVSLPVCAKDGFTAYTCRICGNTYMGNLTKRLAHWYGTWTSNGDGTHSAVCRRDGCGYTMKTGCAYYEMKLGEQLLRVCPICGGTDSLPFEAVNGTAANADKNALPRGELVLFKAVNPFGEAPLIIPGRPETNARVLYAFTTAYEFAGKLESFNGKVRLSLPREGLTDFILVRFDENSVWTEIPCVFENGTLSFETDSAGLFLIILRD